MLKKKDKRQCETMTMVDVVLLYFSPFFLKSLLLQKKKKSYRYLQYTATSKIYSREIYLHIILSLL